MQQYFRTEVECAHWIFIVQLQFDEELSDRLSFVNDALQNEGTEVSCVLLTLWICV